MSISEQVRALALRYRKEAQAIKAEHPLALSDAALAVVWRDYVKRDPQIGVYRDEFIRVAKGEMIP